MQRASKYTFGKSNKVQAAETFKNKNQTKTKKRNIKFNPKEETLRSPEEMSTPLAAKTKVMTEK